MTTYLDNKRSDVNELRGKLQNLEIQRDRKQYRDAVQKVIMYMTFGVDVSRLFSEMIMASATDDLVQKKLVYLYLCNYAESHTELTLLAVNTLQKNCRDPNPMVRGLALRSMCGLRVPNLGEYVLTPLLDGLRDKSPYVRKTAVMGCVKMFYTSETLVLDSGIVETLYGMVRDRDPLVFANTILAIEEISASEGGIVLSKDIAHSIFNRLREFSEWAQCSLMGLVLRYVPDNEDEVFDILNVLDDRLKSPSSAVILATTKLFLHYTRNIADIHTDILARIKVPLITTMSASCAELSYTILHHIELLATRAPAIFAADYKVFFCRYNDPSYVKLKKLELMTTIINTENLESIIEELAAYVTDVDVTLARKSINAMGKIAIRLSSATDYVITMLVAFLELDTPYVLAETVITISDVLRKYPDRSSRITPHIAGLVRTDLLEEESDARVAVLWLLAEYGEQVEDAPYLLEPIIDDVGEEENHRVRLQLLTTTMKLFLKRPPECQHMLGRLLQQEIEDEDHMDVHDRALVYYRLLQTSVSETERIVCAPMQPVMDFTKLSEANQARVYEEFNSLSVIYNQPAEMFITDQKPYNAVGLATPRTDVEERTIPQSTPNMMGINAAAHNINNNNTGSAASANLLDGLESVTAGKDPDMQLISNPVLTPAEFEKLWVSSEISASFKDILRNVPAPGELEQILLRSNIAMLASSPPTLGVIKFFFYAQETPSQAYHLVEANVSTDSLTLQANFKSNGVRSPDFATMFRRALAALIE